MRAGFGLVGLLICIGVIVWIMGGKGGTLEHTQQVLKSGEKARGQVNVLSGNSTDGSMKFSDSLDTDLIQVGGHTDNILVTKIIPGGPADTYYGLKKDDCIVELGDLGPVRSVVNSEDDAKAFLMDTYQHQRPLTVVRNGQKVTLPQAGATAPPATPTGAKNNSGGGGLQGQLDAIQNSPR